MEYPWPNEGNWRTSEDPKDRPSLLKASSVTRLPMVNPSCCSTLPTRMASRFYTFIIHFIIFTSSSLFLQYMASTRVDIHIVYCWDTKQTKLCNVHFIKCDAGERRSFANATSDSARNPEGIGVQCGASRRGRLTNVLEALLNAGNGAQITTLFP